MSANQGTLTTHIHLDAVGGVAGDMFVAAMLDARPDLRARVFEDIAAVLPVGIGRAELFEVLSGGIAALSFGLVQESENSQGNRQTTIHQQLSDDPDINKHHGAHFAELVDCIMAAPLHPGTAEQSIAILKRLAISESHMHRVKLEDVHFHEIGDWDSLLDVVAAGSIIAVLAPSTWSVSALPLGGGLVHTQHGLLPVPAPATADLLLGFVWRDDGIAGERVTPTGAAIISHLVNPDVVTKHTFLKELKATGIGAGTRNLSGIPNILRAMVYTECTEKSHNSPEALSEDASIIVISFDIDDMTGEEIGIASDRLRDAEGILDLSIGIRQGKKGRPLQDFRLLVKPSHFERISNLCFRETSTIGLRWHHEERICLSRTFDTISVDDMVLRRKYCSRPENEISIKVESDDIASIDSLAKRRQIGQRSERVDNAKIK